MVNSMYPPSRFQEVLELTRELPWKDHPSSVNVVPSPSLFISCSVGQYTVPDGEGPGAGVGVGVGVGLGCGVGAGEALQQHPQQHEPSSAPHFEGSVTQLQSQSQPPRAVQCLPLLVILNPLKAAAAEETISESTSMRDEAMLPGLVLLFNVCRGRDLTVVLGFALWAFVVFVISSTTSSQVANQSLQPIKHLDTVCDENTGLRVEA